MHENNVSNASPDNLIMEWNHNKVITKLPKTSIIYLYNPATEFNDISMSNF
jgi:hypothetical protein